MAILAKKNPAAIPIPSIANEFAGKGVLNVIDF